MAVNAHIYPAGATLAQHGQKLHELLTAQGWELLYANAGAIGSGTAQNPKWDSTAAAANTSAGIATYRMPLAGLTNRWVVQIELRWVTSNTIYGITTTIAQGVDAAGQLTAPGRANGGSYANAGPTLENWITASEYGFAIGGSGGTWHGLERRRLTGNTYNDNLTTHQYSNSASTGFPTGGYNVTRNWVTGEFAEQPLVFLAGFGTTTGVLAVSTLSSSDNNVGYPIGPFGTSNGLGGVLRHVQCWRPSDCVAGVDQAIEIDGRARLYYASNATGPTGARILMARE